MALDRGYLRKRGKVWWIRWTSPSGKTHDRTTKYSDRRAAEREANRLIRRQEQVDAGMLAPDEGAELPDLVGRWQAYVAETRDRSEKHARDGARTVRRFLEAERLHLVRDLSWQAAEGWLQDQRAELGWSARTYNKHRGYLRAWGRWLAERAEVVGANPFAGVDPISGPDVYHRRALEPEESQALIASSPWPRSAMYLTVLTTGLRRGEVERLEWRDVGARKGLLVVRYESGKAEREDTLPLGKETATALEQLLELCRQGIQESPADVAHVRELAEQGLSVDAISKQLRQEGRKRRTANRWSNWWWKDVRNVLEPRQVVVEPTELVFGVEARRSNEAGLYADLERAGIAQDTPGRGVVDWHSLRHTFATSLRRAGVHRYTIQRLMRHSDPRLTAKTYQDYDVGELRAAVESWGLSA